MLPDPIRIPRVRICLRLLLRNATWCLPEYGSSSGKIAKIEIFQKILASVGFRLRSGTTGVMHTAVSSGCADSAKGGRFLAHSLLFTIQSILRRVVMDDNSAARHVQIGFIRFRQLTLP